ncbi:Z1 domain-containing protein [Streptomyces griseorubiginosus]|uniref:Z1 domain-containing protein n=1 Tax=Streptomyces griseorubiginosus TaxID=67304 RepID=UPI001AD7704C|nr:Z1 domain-containing protein [Streptomyces griseorubiginosus]MBO4258041.1 endonuclease [Streptomyces griseorubiginosus]
MSYTPANVLLDIHASALAGMAHSPKHFERWAALAADEDYPDADLSEERFHACLVGADEALTALWSRHLTAWDFAEEPQWALGAPARTDERRAVIYDRLRFGSDLRKALDHAVPVAKLPGPTVITREFTRWYTPERTAARSFYWKSYEEKLRDKGWSNAAIASLDEASRAVVERLTDPEQSAARQAKGLVVGYVQSGKTANFTGVTAKSIDAGYRLVIVLSGTLNLLRAQTQRRLDMELIGQENILRGADINDLDTLVGVDYVSDDDADWPDFVQHGGRPSTLGAFDIERLTTRDKDYKSLAQGIRALEFEKREPTRPLYDPANLHHAAARVLVVKKNKSVLTKLVKDLKQIHGLLGELPALIIDDESDQASVNTLDPKKWEAGTTERTAINGLISQLLKLLPRAQYVGYTATPFANVFVDPGDDEDVFPSDFLISLPRPTGYMGAQDFHDLDSPVADGERTFANSQERAHVRGIYESSGDRLQEAMDAFVLTGALKLYRAAHGLPEAPFRHHTMLVHQSVRKDDHADLALRINSMWHQAGYSSSAGHERLASLWAADFVPVSEARASDLPSPASYDDLRPYVSEARRRIGSNSQPVIVVNGDSDRYFDQLDLDFDRTPHVWKILVGGTKLSRGFTVEGLTITYYRRTTQQADTLMQMGRWFGFRPGYRDLVRLYIGREEPFGRDKTADLYEAYEAVCRDEETFREQLARYAVVVDGEPQLTPMEVPPLVAQHLPWVRPSARNKMFNAELVEVRSPGRPIEPASYPLNSAAQKRNTERWRPLLDKLGTTPVSFSNPPDSASSLTRTFEALTGLITHEALMGVLSQLEWERPRYFDPHLTYLRQLDGSLAKVDDWLLVSPRLASNTRVEAGILGSVPLSLVRRKRQAGKTSFGRITSVEHRTAAQRLIDNAAPPLALHPDQNAGVGPTTGIILLYPVVDGDNHSDVRAAVRNGSADPSKIVMAFTLIPPTSAMSGDRRLVRFRAKDSRHRHDATIPLSNLPSA